MSIKGNRLHGYNLLESAPYPAYEAVDGKGKHLVLVDRGDEYVVSSAYENEDGWVQGHYFRNLEEAARYYNERRRRECAE